MLIFKLSSNRFNLWNSSSWSYIICYNTTVVMLYTPVMRFWLKLNSPKRPKQTHGLTFCPVVAYGTDIYKLPMKMHGFIFYFFFFILLLRMRWASLCCNTIINDFRLSCSHTLYVCYFSDNDGKWWKLEVYVVRHNVVFAFVFAVDAGD